jgi:hypothetical protein
VATLNPHELALLRGCAQTGEGKTLPLVSSFKRTQQVPETDERALAAYRARNPVDEPQAVQKARAKQPGRGRMADSPFAIPWLGWKDILWRTWNGIAEDHLLTLAGGVAFFALLALVPALSAGVSSYALFADAQCNSRSVESRLLYRSPLGSRHHPGRDRSDRRQQRRSVDNELSWWTCFVFVERKCCDQSTI